MKHFILPILVMAMGLPACSAEKRADMESEKMAQFNLTSDQREVADALVEGYKKDMGIALLRSQDYARAACYAKTVKMPSRFNRAHTLYLANYPEADKNWEGYFEGQGVNANTAYDMSEIFLKAYDKCSTGALIKRALQKQN